MSELQAALKEWPEKVSLSRAQSRLQMDIRIGKEPKEKVSTGTLQSRIP